jgi:2-phosphosulfolactate phosphatase
LTLSNHWFGFTQNKDDITDMKPKIEVCLTPDLVQHFELEGKVVVIVDIFRATSCMTTALANGVEKIIPVATTEECKEWQAQGYLAAAERNGQKVEGFDLGNSPFEYMNPDLKGKTIVVSTSNGTLAIQQSQYADTVVIGSFLNKDAVVRFVLEKNQDTVIFCAGWKGKDNMEDTFYAGALLQDLIPQFQPDNDSCVLAQSIYEAGKNNALEFLRQAAHYQRLLRLGYEKDIAFCLTENKYDVLPILKGEELVLE